MSRIGTASVVNKYNALINTQDLAEYYLPGFRSCFRDAKAGAVMCSYNAVTGDCGTVDGVYANHGDGQSDAQGVAFALSNGTDVNCGTSYSTNLLNATTEKYVTEDQIDLALKQLYGSLVTVGYIDSPADQPHRSIDWSQVNTMASKQLAYTALVKGITLLKDDDNILPIKLKGQRFYLPDHPSAHCQHFRIHWEVLYSEGLQTGLDNDTSPFAAAVTAAKDADVVVYFGGIDESVEAESRDRFYIDWPGKQLDLIQQLAANSNVKGLLRIGYPGQEYGPAVIDALSGRATPAGRLLITQYPTDYINQVPMTDQSLRPNSSNPGRTYRWYNNSVIPFGTDLHYTNYSVSWAHGGSGKKTYQITKLTKTSTSPIDLTLFDSFRIEVNSVGSATSDYVALLFLKSSNAGPAPYPSRYWYHMLALAVLLLEPRRL
ncbi:unnamed protein product [Umbelopsis sp. WA50703]